MQQNQSGEDQEFLDKDTENDFSSGPTASAPDEDESENEAEDDEDISDDADDDE